MEAGWALGKATYSHNEDEASSNQAIAGLISIQNSTRVTTTIAQYTMARQLLKMMTRAPSPLDLPSFMLIAGRLSLTHL